MVLLKIQFVFKQAYFYGACDCIQHPIFHRVEVPSPVALVAGQGLTCRDAAAVGANVAVVVD